MVEGMTFKDSVDFAQLVKIYGHLPTGRQGYAPPKFVEAVSRVVTGWPDPMFVSTSYIERQNLTLRMMSRRFTRLTSAFSKKLSHLKAAITLHFAYYNFLPRSPDVEADSLHGCGRYRPCVEFERTSQGGSGFSPSFNAGESHHPERAPPQEPSSPSGMASLPDGELGMQ